MATARMSDEAHEMLGELAKETGRTEQDLLDEAVERLNHELFFDCVDAAYRRLRSDSAAWAAEKEERALWDCHAS